MLRGGARYQFAERDWTTTLPYKVMYLKHLSSVRFPTSTSIMRMLICDLEDIYIYISFPGLGPNKRYYLSRAKTRFRAKSKSEPGLDFQVREREREMLDSSIISLRDKQHVSRERK